MFKSIFSMLLSVALLQSCNVNNGSDTSFEILNGKFSGVVIEGLKYTSGETTGLTNDLGEYKFESNKSITFSIADQSILVFDGTEQLNYLPNSGSVETETTELINFWRLMISLDLDGDIENGIYIDPQIHDFKLDEFNLSDDDFETTINVWIEEYKGVITELVTAEQAINTITNQTNIAYSCGNDHEKVGQTLTFSTLAHDVSGQAEIINNCTIRITNFTFDGGGPAVYFYTGTNGKFTSGQAVSDRLTRAYSNEIVDIAISNLDDFNSLSVWCSNFDANFGSGIFK